MANSVLTKTQWAEIRRLSLSGVKDVDIAHQFGVRTGTIRQRRYDDTAWNIAWKKVHFPPPTPATEKPVESVVPADPLNGASLEEIAIEHTSQLVGFTHGKIKEAVQTNSIPAPQSWAELKTATEILRKAVGLDRDQAPVQLNIWGGAADGVVNFHDHGPVVEIEGETWV